MSTKIYLHLLFFYGILCQGIFATLSDEDTSLSSDPLLRKRRVSKPLPAALGRDESVNYIVKITFGGNTVCLGAILSHDTAITAARCIHRPAMDYISYHVLSGGAHDDQWNFHNITSLKTYYGNPPLYPIDGIFLITVHPSFVYSKKTGNIELHVGPFPQVTLINVFGWERVYPTRPGTQSRLRLRTMTLPTISHQECTNLYREHRHLVVTEKNICTVCAQQFCNRDDIGGPLVLNNRLVGIHTWKGEIPGQINPDVFVNLNLPEYSEWIRAHIHRM